MGLRGYIIILKRDGISGSFCDWRADKCIFGSDPSCDVHIKLDSVAPFHCKLETTENEGVFIENLGKFTKTYLNGVSVPERTFVEHNSRLTIVDRDFKFLYPENSIFILKRPVIREVLMPPISFDPPQCIPGASPFSKLVSSSLKHSPFHPVRSRTPTFSSQRKALSTKERYGPTPVRPEPSLPSVNVERHALKRSSNIGKRFSPLDSLRGPIRKKAKVNVISETPSASGTQYIRSLRKSLNLKEDTNQTNNSSHFLLDVNRSNDLDLFNESFSSPSDLSSTATPSKSNVKPPDVASALMECHTSEVSDSCASSLSSAFPVTSYGLNTNKKYVSEQAVRKGVQFGPKLSPEQFDSRLPPSTPLKRGEVPFRSSKRISSSAIKRPRSASYSHKSFSPGCRARRSALTGSLGHQPTSVELNTRSNLHTLSKRLGGSFTAASDNPINVRSTSASNQRHDVVGNSLRLSKTRSPGSKLAKNNILLRSPNLSSSTGQVLSSLSPGSESIHLSAQAMSQHSPLVTISTNRSTGIDDAREKYSAGTRTPSSRPKSLESDKGRFSASRSHKSLASSGASPQPDLQSTFERSSQRKSAIGYISDVGLLVETPLVPSSSSSSDVLESEGMPKRRRSNSLYLEDDIVSLRKSKPRSRSSVRLSGVRWLIKTPIIPSPPQLSGILKLLQTPLSTQPTRHSDIRNLTKVPKSLVSPSLSGIGKLLKTPNSRLSTRPSSLPRLLQTDSIASEMAVLQPRNKFPKRKYCSLESTGGFSSHILPLRLKEVSQKRSLSESVMTESAPPNTVFDELVTADGEPQSKRIRRARCEESGFSHAPVRNNTPAKRGRPTKLEESTACVTPVIGETRAKRGRRAKLEKSTTYLTSMRGDFQANRGGRVKSKEPSSSLTSVGGETQVKRGRRPKLEESSVSHSPARIETWAKRGRRAKLEESSVSQEPALGKTPTKRGRRAKLEEPNFPSSLVLGATQAKHKRWTKLEEPSATPIPTRGETQAKLGRQAKLKESSSLLSTRGETQAKRGRRVKLEESSVSEAPALDKTPARRGRWAKLEEPDASLIRVGDKTQAKRGRRAKLEDPYAPLTPVEGATKTQRGRSTKLEEPSVALAPKTRFKHEFASVSGSLPSMVKTKSQQKQVLNRTLCISPKITSKKTGKRIVSQESQTSASNKRARFQIRSPATTELVSPTVVKTRSGGRVRRALADKVPPKVTLRSKSKTATVKSIVDDFSAETKLSKSEKRVQFADLKAIDSIVTDEISATLVTRSIFSKSNAIGGAKSPIQTRQRLTSNKKTQGGVESSISKTVMKGRSKK